MMAEQAPRLMAVEQARAAVEGVANAAYMDTLHEAFEAGSLCPSVLTSMAAVDAAMERLRLGPERVIGCGERFEVADVREAIGWVMGDVDSQRQDYLRRKALAAGGASNAETGCSAGDCRHPRDRRWRGGRGRDGRGLRDAGERFEARGCEERGVVAAAKDGAGTRGKGGPPPPRRRSAATSAVCSLRQSRT